MSLRLIGYFICLISFSIATPNPDCISKAQQFEIPHCCQMEEIISLPIRTKCQENAAYHHNPGSRPYFVCQAQCIFEELHAIDGDKVQLEKLYPLTERFPVDYRNAVRLAIDECNARLQSKPKKKPVDGDRCPSLGIEVDNCLHRTTFSNCPDSRWKVSIACNKVRQGMPFC